MNIRHFLCYGIIVISIIVFAVLMPNYPRKTLGFFSRIVDSNYSSCGRCGMSWKFAEGHNTDYIEASPERIGRGIFPLCEHCWSKLTPNQRLPYYRELWNKWHGYEEDLWITVEKAVLEGK